MKRFGITAAAVFAAAAVVFFLLSFLTRPPRPATLTRPAWTPVLTAISGAYHIHSRRSDGSGSIDDIAAAAARAGLAFVIVTDHGDGTQTVPPAYRNGVLCIEGVEISTSGGHYVALGMRPAPYPLGGDPRDVVEDVARLGGFGIAAHPSSAKPALRWTDWNLPIDGIEWVNADSEWRARSAWPLVTALAHYPFRPAASLAALFVRPVDALSRWDTLTAHRKVVGLAGADAHARIGLSASDPRDDAWFLRVPGYESSFRAFSNHVELDHPLTGQAAADAARVLQAIEAGHVFASIDGLAHPAAFQFRAESGAHMASEGDDLLLDGPVSLHAQTNDPAAEVVLFRDGVAINRSTGSDVTFHAPADPAVFRVEVRRAGREGPDAIPWIVSNPIYVRGTARVEPPPFPGIPPSASESLLPATGTAGWSIEHETQSQGALDRAPAAPHHRVLEMHFTLGEGTDTGQYVAAVHALGPEVALFDHLAFAAQASQPLRLSVQFRDQDGRRWQQSVYVSTASRAVVMPFTDLQPIDPGLGPRPNLDRVRDLLFVIDTTNASPGFKGSVKLGDVRLER